MQHFCGVGLKRQLWKALGEGFTLMGATNIATAEGNDSQRGKSTRRAIFWKEWRRNATQTKSSLPSRAFVQARYSQSSPVQPCSKTCLKIFWKNIDAIFSFESAEKNVLTRTLGKSQKWPSETLGGCPGLRALTCSFGFSCRPLTLPTSIRLFPTFI